jgi:hypothetical protein
MTILLHEPEILSHFDKLSFSRTVDRSLLHRAALSEVFLTDAQRIDVHRYVAAAQLPPAHPYYTHHALHDRVPDPLLLLECARQAETFGAHEFFGVGIGAKFVLRRWSMRLPGLLTVTAPRGPAELTMLVTTHHARAYRGTLRSLSYEIDLSIGGHGLGRVQIDVSYLPPDTYDFMRLQRRGSRPPSTSDYRPVQGQRRVAPHLVGRTNPVDVLLLDPVIGPQRICATLRVPIDNFSMFDHEQDHVPGMVLTEAARQICLLAGNEYHGRSSASTTMLSVDALFTSYAELDKTTTVMVEQTPVEESVDASITASAPPARPMPVVFEQDGVPISRATLVMGELLAGTDIPAGAGR